MCIRTEFQGSGLAQGSVKLIQEDFLFKIRKYSTFLKISTG